MKSKKVKTTTMDPSYEYFYIYGDPSERNLYEDDWLFEGFSDHLVEYAEIVSYIKQVYEVACFVSFFINLIHLFILTRKELRTNIVFIVMIGVCVCDIAQSLGKIIQLGMTNDIIYKIEPCYGGFKYSHLMVDLISKCMQILSRQSSGFLVLYIAAFRAFSIIFPMSDLTQRLMKPKFGFIVVFSTVIVSSIWSFFYFIRIKFKKIIYCEFGNRPSYIPYELDKNSRMENFFLFIDSSIILCLCILYVFVTAALVIAIVKNRKKRKAASNDKGSNPSLMIIFMAFTVFLSQFAYAGFYFANYFIFQGYEEQKVLADLDTGVLTLFILNSAIHAFICFLMSSQYRNTVIGMICGSKTKKETTAPVENTLNSINETPKASNSSRKTF